MSQSAATDARLEPDATRGFVQRLAGNAVAPRGWAAIVFAVFAFAATMPPVRVVAGVTPAQTGAVALAGIPRFDIPSSGLRLERPTRTGAFVDVVGRRAAFVGY